MDQGAVADLCTRWPALAGCVQMRTYSASVPPPPERGRAPPPPSVERVENPSQSYRERTQCGHMPVLRMTGRGA
eukprot:358804-Chlamydomonas_euryale.AAC.2